MGKFGKGLNRDSSPVDQPEGTWRYAKNAVVKKELGGISNESGTETSGTMRGPGNYTFIGKIEISSDLVILFSVKTGTNRGEIGIFQNDQYITLLNLANTSDSLSLNFNSLNLISGTFKYDTQNNLIIYWTDNSNPPKTLNVTQQKLSPTHLIYNKLIWTNYNISYVSILDLFPNAGTSPILDNGEIVSGGSITTAAYNLAIAYKTEDGTYTNYIIISSTVHINDETLSGSLERLDGATNDAETGKAIKWKLSNYNNSYKFIQPTILKRTESKLEAFELPIIKLWDASGAVPPTITITYTNVEALVNVPTESVLVDKISYATVRDLTLLEDRLYAANLTSDLFPDYQPYANFIKTTGHQRVIPNFEALYLTDNSVNQGGSAPYHVTSSYKNLDKDVLPTGYKRGEVYAFYIAFILNDGSMSQAYHIPGRDAIEDERSTYNAITNSHGGEYDCQEYMNGESLFNYEIEDYALQPSSRKMNFWENKDSKYPGTDSYDIKKATNSGYSATLKGEKVRHHRFPENFADHPLPTSTNYGFHQGITTTSGSVITNNSSPYVDLGSNNYSLIMTDEQPANVNEIFISNSIISNYGIAIGDTLRIGNVDVVILGSNVGSSTTSFVFSATNLFMYNSFYDPLIIPAQLVTATVSSVLWLDPNYITGSVNTSVIDGFVPAVAIQGFQLADIQIPHNIASRVQGFEIFRSKRKHFDKTSIGQGLAMPMMRSKRQAKDGAPRLNTVWSPVPLPWRTMEEGYEGAFPSPGNSLGLGQDFCQNGVSFHDFTLLREKLSIKQADYLKMQVRLKFKMYIGPWDDYNNSGGNHQVLVTGYGVAEVADNTNGMKAWPFLIHKGAKTYVPGRSYYRVDSNFAVEAINNIGGNSKICLHLSTPLPLYKTYNQGEGTGGLGPRWALNIFGDQYTNQGQSMEPNIKSVNLEDAVYGTQTINGDDCVQNQYMYLVDLKSFKRNVYIDFMERSLISTGYRVTGAEFQRFTVDASGAPNGPHPDDTSLMPNFKTGPIFGGDTFISRYTFRATWEAGCREYNGRLVKSTSVKGLYSYLTESSDNIGMQHSEGIGTAFASTYFPKQLLWSWEKTCLTTLTHYTNTGVLTTLNADWYHTCACLDLTAHKTATHPGDTEVGIIAGDPEGYRYNTVYSMHDSLKTPRPRSFYEIDVDLFPTRVIRSMKGGTVYDSNRLFNALDFIDVNKNTGDINNIITLHNQLFIHTQNSLYKTIGKQKMETSSGSAFIGSGDIFAQAPETIIQTDLGYGGNQSLYSFIVSRYGYFWIDLKNKKVMCFTDKVEVISDIGMSIWFKENLPEAWELDTPYAQNGIHMEEDVVNKRLLITRKTNDIHHPIRNWTISYQLDYKQWVSFHDYVPNMYLYLNAQSGAFLYSIFNHPGGSTPYNSINKHRNDIYNMCTFPGFDQLGNDTVYDFEFGYVDQQQQESSKTYSNFFYNIEARDTQKSIQHHTGFTSFYVYNKQQTSGIVDITYLQNTRKNEGSWFVSGFRDMSGELLDTTYSGTNNYLGVNLPGTISTGNTDMFNSIGENNGMHHHVNSAYLDASKDWTRRGKFIDKYLNIHLISDNSDNLLLTLYFAGASKRLSYR